MDKRTMSEEFCAMDDCTLLLWCRQYGDSASGFYPGIRRVRRAAMDELTRRGLPYPARSPRWDWAGWRTRMECPSA